jgi:hypothetical protein
MVREPESPPEPPAIRAVLDAPNVHGPRRGQRWFGEGSVALFDWSGYVFPAADVAAARATRASARRAEAPASLGEPEPSWKGGSDDEEDCDCDKEDDDSDYDDDDESDCCSDEDDWP